MRVIQKLTLFLSGYYIHFPENGCFNSLSLLRFFSSGDKADKTDIFVMPEIRFVTLGY